MSMNYNKAGRKKGQKATKDKYIIECKNIKDNKWEELGRYPSLLKASKDLDISYGLLSDVNIGRRKLYSKFYRITTIKKYNKDKLDKLDDDNITPIDMIYVNNTISNLLADSDEDSEISM